METTTTVASSAPTKLHVQVPSTKTHSLTDCFSIFQFIAIFCYGVCFFQHCTMSLRWATDTVKRTRSVIANIFGDLYLGGVEDETSSDDESRREDAGSSHLLRTSTKETKDVRSRDDQRICRDFRDEVQGNHTFVECGVAEDSSTNRSSDDRRGNTSGSLNVSSQRSFGIAATSGRSLRIKSILNRSEPLRVVPTQSDVVPTVYPTTEGLEMEDNVFSRRSFDRLKESENDAYADRELPGQSPRLPTFSGPSSADLDDPGVNGPVRVEVRRSAAEVVSATHCENVEDEEDLAQDVDVETFGSPLQRMSATRTVAHSVSVREQHVDGEDNVAEEADDETFGSPLRRMSTIRTVIPFVRAAPAREQHVDVGDGLVEEADDETFGSPLQRMSTIRTVIPFVRAVPARKQHVEGGNGLAEEADDGTFGSPLQRLSTSRSVTSSAVETSKDGHSGVADADENHFGSPRRRKRGPVLLGETWSAPCSPDPSSSSSNQRRQRWMTEPRPLSSLTLGERVTLNRRRDSSYGEVEARTDGKSALRATIRPVDADCDEEKREFVENFSPHKTRAGGIFIDGASTGDDGEYGFSHLRKLNQRYQRFVKRAASTPAKNKMSQATDNGKPK